MTKRHKQACFAFLFFMLAVKVSAVITEKSSGIVGETSPVLFYHFNESQDTVAHDLMGKNTGTISGATWVSGKFGSALQFNGTSDYIRVSDTSSLNPTSEITIEAWIKPADSFHAGSNYAIVSKVGSYASYQGYYLQYDSGDAGIRFLIGDGAAWSAFNYTADLTAGMWYYVAVTFKNGAATIYLNGNSTSASLSSAISPSNVSLKIGANDWGEGPTYGYFNGIIDEVKIHNHALTAEEILSRYEAITSEIYDASIARRSKTEWAPTTNITLQIRSAANTPALLSSAWSLLEWGGYRDLERYVQYKIYFLQNSSILTSFELTPQPFIKSIKITPPPPIKTGSLLFDVYFNYDVSTAVNPTLSFMVDDKTYTSTQGLAGAGWEAGAWSDSQHYSVIYTNIAGVQSGFAVVKISGAVNTLGETMSEYIDSNVLFIDLSNLSSAKTEFFPDPFSPNGDGKNEITRLVNLPVLMQAGYVSAKIYNLKGAFIKTLLDEQCPAGSLSIPQWDGTDNGGKPCPIGLYLFQLKIGEKIISGTVTLVK